MADIFSVLKHISIKKKQTKLKQKTLELHNMALGNYFDF